MKSQESMTLPNEHYECPVPNPSKMEAYELKEESLKWLF